MAAYYVYSGAGGAGTGADWANAYTTLKAAVEAGGTAAGDTFYVADDHAETQASALTFTTKGTAAAPDRILCVLRSGGSVPPVSADLRTTATISTTGANSLTANGIFYCEGIIFQSGSGAVASSLFLGASGATWQRYKNCKFRLVNTASGQITPGTLNVANLIEWDNCQVKFGAAAHSIKLQYLRFIWRNSSSAVDATGTLPTSLFTGSSASPAQCYLEGVDLSALTSKNLTAGTGIATRTVLKDCKKPTGLTAISGATGLGHNEVIITRSANGAVYYDAEKYNYLGSQVADATYARTGGATDGTTPISWKFVTVADCDNWFQPFESLPMAVWNDTVAGNITVTLYCLITSGSIPNDDEIWVDIEYLGSAASPLGSFATSTKADVLAASAATNNVTDASTWSGGGTPTLFKIAKTISAPAVAGLIYVTVKIAKASFTVYVDPKVVVS
jgi:hypothetical protein